MTVATVMVYVDASQQAEAQVRVARSIASKFDASIVGISALAVEPDLVAEGVIIQATTPDDLKQMKTALADKEQWFRDIIDLPKEKVEWRWNVEYPAMFLANEARSADLVVLKRKQEKINPYRFIDPAEAVLPGCAAGHRRTQPGRMGQYLRRHTDLLRRRLCPRAAQGS